MSDIPNTNEIVTFLHCGLCIKGLPKGTSPREHASVEVGYTKQGLQVWCKRHECNIIHIDFEGQKFYANTFRRGLHKVDTNEGQSE